VFASGGNNGQILCAREVVGDPEINIAISGTTLTHTGWTTVYLNGVSVSSGVTIVKGVNYHVCAILSSGVASKINFGAHYDGTLSPVGTGIAAVATYDRVLTANEAKEHYLASHGLILGKTDVPDTISLTETVPPEAYQNAWASSAALT
jgi:hypothetical protein